MPWNPAWPDVTKSVKANGATGVQNSNFIDTSMKRDHFWDQLGADDGRHRQVQMPKTETGGLPDDITLAGTMNGGMYLKDNTDGVTAGFYINGVNIYQFIPAFLTGIKNFTDTSTYVDIVAVPDNTYGQIFMFKQPTLGNSPVGVQTGWFRAVNGICQSYSNSTIPDGSSTGIVLLKLKSFPLAGGDLFIKGHPQTNASISGSSGNWEYRVTYWDI